MEPTRPSCRAIMSPRRAAYLKRLDGRTTIETSVDMVRIGATKVIWE